MYVAGGSVLDEHVERLTRVVLANFTDRQCCWRKTRWPPGDAALKAPRR
jgi:hypothetical protein